MPRATLEIDGIAMNQAAHMGGELVLSSGGVATIATKATGLPSDARLVLVAHGLDTGEVSRTLHAQTVTVQLVSGATSGYIRPEARDKDGKLLILGNPIYIRR